MCNNEYCFTPEEPRSPVIPDHLWAFLLSHPGGRSKQHLPHRAAVGMGEIMSGHVWGGVIIWCTIAYTFLGIL